MPKCCVAHYRLRHPPHDKFSQVVKMQASCKRIWNGTLGLVAVITGCQMSLELSNVFGFFSMAASIAGSTGHAVINF